MIAYGTINARLKVLNDRHNEIDAMWQSVKDLPEDVEDNMRRKFQTMAALQISKGRILECQVWLEWADRWPDIERPDQLPTEGNMMSHDAIPDKKTEKQAKRERELVHRGNADQLAAALPDLT